MKHTEMSRSGRIQVPVLPQRRPNWWQQFARMVRAWLGRSTR